MRTEERHGRTRRSSAGASPPTWRKKLPELSHVKAGRVLFVAGEARRGSRATIKPLANTRILLRGKRAFYCITLRPKFFRASTPEERVETLLHELLHISAEFDGRLHEERRHSSLPGAKFRSLLRPLVRRYLAQAEPKPALRPGAPWRGGGAPVARAPHREVEPRTGVHREASLPGARADDYPPAPTFLTLEIEAASCEVPRS